jgi:hypothetical protein
MKLPGVKSYKSIKEALGDISKQCDTLHNKTLAEINKANSDLAQGVKNGPVQKGTR